MATAICEQKPFEDDNSVPSAMKRKADLMKKSELLREVHKLDIQIQALEREKSTHIFSKRSDFRQDFMTLEEAELKLTEERKTEKIKLKQQLEKLSHMVKRLHRELRDIKPTPEFVAKLKSIMEEIETALTAFKEQQKMNYEELMRSERTLGQELQLLDKKFEAWAKAPRTETPSQRAPKQTITCDQDVTKDLPPEVAAFDKFVYQSGGHRGGWDEYDHQTFIKHRNMYKGRIVFLDHVKPFLPIRTEDEIREHETWYQEYLFLNENKKYAIKKWREKKEEAKDDLLSQAKNDPDDSEEEEKNTKALQKKIADEKCERYKQLNAWRVQKELEKAMKEERKMKQDLEKVRTQEEERKRQLEIKKQVEEFRQQKKQEEEMLEMMEEERKRQETEQKREISARELGRFRNRDVQRLHEKLEKEKLKEEKERQKQRKLEALKSQVQVQVQRDPSRLLKPTAGWKERLKEPGPSGGGQVLSMPHRAIPSWRQGP